MPTFETPALYIDFSRLEPPRVIEEVSFEAILKAYREDVIARSEGRLARAVALEQSPTNVVLEVEAYAEMMVRARINSAARAVMLPFAIGTDLDVLAAFYSVLNPETGRADIVTRMPLVANPRPFSTNPEDWETDERFRRRVQLAPEAMSPAGTAGGYIFHAMAADVTIRDASAICPSPGVAQIAIMNSGADPIPTSTRLAKVRARLNNRLIKPLTDIVKVQSAEKIGTALIADLTLYPGPDQALVLNDISTALDKVRGRISKLGRDLPRSALFAALNQEGVQGVSLKSPAIDLEASDHQCVVIESATINFLPMRRE